MTGARTKGSMPFDLPLRVVEHRGDYADSWAIVNANKLEIVRTRGDFGAHKADAIALAINTHDTLTAQRDCLVEALTRMLSNDPECVCARDYTEPDQCCAACEARTALTGLGQ